MDWTGIIWAAAIVGGTGLIIGLLLGIAGRKFAVKVNEMEVAVREITAAGADIRAVTAWLQRLLPARRRWMAVRWAARLWLEGLHGSWGSR